MKNLPKSRVKETIDTGIGRFFTKKPRALLLVDAYPFIERHCIYPELYQDIINDIQKVIDKNKLRPVAFLRPADFFSIYFGLIRSHNLIELQIYGHRQYSKFSDDLFSYKIETKYLRITNDGLIADIIDYDELPKYNPHNVVTVVDRDPREFH